LVSMVSHRSLLSSSNFSDVGGVEVIGLGRVIVAVNRDNRKRRVAQNTFRLVSVVSNSSVLGCSNLTSVGGVEVIVFGRVKVAENRDSSRDGLGGNVPITAFGCVSMVSDSTLLGCSNFTRVGGVEVIAFASVIVAVNRNDVSTTSKAKNQVKSRFLLDVVVAQSASILKLLTSEDESLLIRRNTLLVLNLLLHVVDGIRRFDFERYGLASQCLNEDLHVEVK